MGSSKMSPMQSHGGSKNLTDWSWNWSTGLKIGANRVGPRPWPFPGPPGAGLGREAAQNQRFPVLPPTKQTLKHCSGYLKAVWPDFWGAFLRSGRPRGARGRGRVHEFLSGFGVFGCCSWVSGRLSYPPRAYFTWLAFGRYFILKISVLPWTP